MRVYKNNDEVFSGCCSSVSYDVYQSRIYSKQLGEGSILTKKKEKKDRYNVLSAFNRKRLIAIFSVGDILTFERDL